MSAFELKDIDTFHKLADDGVKFDVRQVPSELPDDMNDILKKATDELNAQK